MNILQMNPHETKVIPLIADPVFHATCPPCANRVMDAYDINAIMLPIRVQAGALKEFITYIKKYMNCPGFLLSTPLKQEIIPLLDKVDPLSAQFQEITAVRINEDGTLEGKGFDGIGVVGAIREKHDVAGMNVTMIGAGAISGAIAAEFGKYGARKMTILNRTVEKAAHVAKIVGDMTEMEITYGPLDAEHAAAAVAECDCLVQATSLGSLASPTDYEDLSFLEHLNKNACLLDVVNNPPETKFVKRAQELGFQPMMGFDMQAVETVAILEFLFQREIGSEYIEVCRQAICSHVGYQRKY